jgi:transcription antitermination factor NusG
MEYLLAVIIEIFGRDTPVELKFQEVKKRPDISPW